MNTQRLSLAAFIVTCSAAIAFAPPPAPDKTAPIKTEQSAEQTAPVKKDQAAKASPEQADPLKSASSHAGKLVEGDKINPYTYEPESIAGDPNNPAETDLRAALEAMGPTATEWYQHVQTLSNPFFEGRVPGSRGNDLAAEYIEFFMKQAGLEPAFPNAAGAAGKSYRQPFELEGGAPVVETAELALNGSALKRQDQFEVMGSSGSGTVTAPLVFAGYAIESGQDGYTSFEEKDNFAGKIVVFLRYEPLDESGASLWSDRRFSGYAGMRPKLDALSERKPAALIMVNPPECKSGAKGLEHTESSVFGPGYDFPIVQITQEQADALLKSADPKGRSLMEFRRLADQGKIKTLALKDDVKATVHVAISEKGLPAQNVGGVIPGKGALASEWVVLGAHYDHVGMGYFGADPSNRGKLHPGADDNASGTSAMLCLAKKLKDYMASKESPDNCRSLLLMGFTAEEMGLDGSREFVKHPTVPSDKIAAMVNMDMVGRLRGNELAMSGTGTAEGFIDLIRPAVESSGLIVKADPGGRGPSDHASFYAAGIPVLFLFTGSHGEYHKPEDRGFTVNPYGASKIITLTEGLVKTLATTPTKPVFKSTDGSAGASRGYAKVRLGVQPGMSKRKSPGLAIDGVSADTSASDAGLKGGDVILTWDGQPMNEASELMDRLREKNPGDIVTLHIMRDGVEQDVNVTLRASEKAGAPAGKK
ncbi:MAG: M28 family peptidase [Planctomycetes bacterium]|nr:M28 family peptidase [Planctomycetota bacterium]